MKRWYAGAAVSIATHAVLVTAIVTPRSPHAMPQRVVVVASHAAAPIDVELFEPAPARLAPARGTARIATTAPIASATSRIDALSRLDTIAVSPIAIAIPLPSVTSVELPEPIAAPIAPIAPIAPVTHAHTGAFTETTKTFTMDVARDGSAHIRDRSNIQLAVPTSRRDIAAALEADHSNDGAPSDDGDRTRSNAAEAIMPSVGATILTFDATDWMMRRHGQDPYASKKLQLLDATRDERAQIGAAFREQALARTPALVQANLERVAALPDAARKQALIELWTDCDDTASGAVARAAIVAYIRAHERFSPEELARVGE